MDMYRSAVLSPCGSFRYRLKRRWDLNNATRKAINFVMLNPSKADDAVDDPTIRKCVGFATRLGFNELRVVNLFAFRATNPRDLAKHGYLPGPRNFQHVMDVAIDSARTHPHEPVVLAWGANARDEKIAAAATMVIAGMQLRGAHMFTLRRLGDGIPAHPLMLPYSCELTPF